MDDYFPNRRDLEKVSFRTFGNNRRRSVMTRLATLLCVFALIITVGCVETGKHKKADASAVRVGVYDSRAIAVAFVGSEVFKQYMTDLKSQHATAEAAGDKKRIAELEEEGAAQQKRFHKQAFSTAPVDNLLKHIKDQILKIEKDAAVQIIVSKWDEKALTQYKSAEQVDVTMQLVEALKPNERQKKSAIEIQKSDPVSLEKMEHHKD